MFRLISRLFSPDEPAAPEPVVFHARPDAPRPESGQQEAVLYAAPTRPTSAEPGADLTDDDAALQRRLAKFDVLLADMQHAPCIESIDLSRYSGQPGEEIRFRARDDFAVVHATVLIENADGSLVEMGEATQQANPLEWLYRATRFNQSLEGDKITIRVSDRPGNRDERVQAL